MRRCTETQGDCDGLSPLQWGGGGSVQKFGSLEDRRGKLLTINVNIFADSGTKHFHETKERYGPQTNLRQANDRRGKESALARTHRPRLEWNDDRTLHEIKAWETSAFDEPARRRRWRD